MSFNNHESSRPNPQKLVAERENSKSCPPPPRANPKDFTRNEEQWQTFLSRNLGPYQASPAGLRASILDKIDAIKAAEEAQQ